MENFLLLIYVGIILKFIQTLRFFQFKNISYQTLGTIFIIKVIAGITYGAVHRVDYWGGDTFFYFHEGNLMYKTFWGHWQYYLQSICGMEPPIPAGFDETTLFTYPPRTEYFKNIGIYWFVHLQAFIRIFSFGYYNIHVLFMAFLSFSGGVLLYRLISEQFNIQYKFLLMAIFALPSSLFWTSGLHKDGIVYVGLIMAVWGVSKLRTFKGWGFMILGSALVLSMRPYLALPLLPGLVALFFSFKYPTGKHFYYFIASYIVFFTFLSLWAWIDESISITHIITTKQQEFFVEYGTSDFTPPHVDTILDILKAVPQAFLNALMRPFIFEVKSTRQFVTSLESMGILFLCYTCVRFFRNAGKSPLIYFFLFYGIANLTLIGLLVSNSGTMARYRVVSIGFWVILLVSFTNYQKIMKTTYNYLERLTSSKST